MTETPAPYKASTATTDLTKFDDGFFDDGLGEVTTEDLIIPRLSLNHKKPSEAIGRIYCNITGDMWDEMTLSVIKFTKSRIMFPSRLPPDNPLYEKYNKDSVPVCRSHNFMEPADDIPDAEPMADTCEECPYSKWIDGNPPSCSECWNLLVIDHETYMPGWLTLKSTTLSAGKRLISALKLRTAARRIPVWYFRFNMILNARPGDSGDSYVPVFTDIVTIDDPATKENMDVIRQQLVRETFQAAVEAEEAVKAVQEEDGEDSGHNVEEEEEF